MTFNPTEQEAIILNTAWEMIDDMVNYSIFVKSEKTENTNLMPQTSAHLRLFNILLGDFLSPLTAKGKGAALPFDLPKPADSGSPSDHTFLFYLERVCLSPQFDQRAEALSGPVRAFSSWLEEEAVIKEVWLPSIDVEVDLRIRRIAFLRICGDIGKHSFARLEGNVKRIVRILADHGHVVDEGMGYATLPEFWEWFHTHLFAYHASTIAEFLNNIRWGIFRYIRPEFERSYERVDPEPMYRFKVPAEVVQPIARSMYWDLMNRARSRPWFPQFTVTQSLKNQF